MDVQGAERKVIEGAVNTLNFTRYLYLEYGETSTYPEAMTREQTIELLSKHNFELLKEYPDTDKTGNSLFVNKRFK